MSRFQTDVVRILREIRDGLKRPGEEREPSARAPDILTEIANASDVVRRAGERSPHVVFVPLARGDELKAASFWFQSREFPTGLRYYGADVWLADVPRIVAGRKVHQA